MPTDKSVNRWEESLQVIQADLHVDVSEISTASSAHCEHIVCDEPSTHERHRLLEISGSLDFWNDPAEDIYSMDDGEPA